MDLFQGEPAPAHYRSKILHRVARCKLQSIASRCTFLRTKLGRMTCHSRLTCSCWRCHSTQPTAYSRCGGGGGCLARWSSSARWRVTSKDAVTRHRLMHQNVKFNCSVNECCSKRPVYTAKFQRGYGRSRFALTGVQNPLTTSLFRPNSDRNPPGVKRNKPGI